MIKRVPKGDYEGLAFPKSATQRPDRNDAVRVTKDGREICRNQAEYKKRTIAMAERQGWMCGCGCGRRMTMQTATFQHTDLRSGGRRNDTIKPYRNVKGQWVQNEAWLGDCNGQQGSVRVGAPYRSKPNV